MHYFSANTAEFRLSDATLHLSSRLGMPGNKLVQFYLAVAIRRSDCAHRLELRLCVGLLAGFGDCRGRVRLDLRLRRRMNNNE